MLLQSKDLIDWSKKENCLNVTSALHLVLQHALNKVETITISPLYTYLKRCEEKDCNLCILIIFFWLSKFDLPYFLSTFRLSEVNDFQVASPLQYQSINTQTGDENTDTDQLKNFISPNIKFSKPVLKEMYRSKKGELLIKSWR